MMSKDQKEKFFEIILLEKDYSKARVEFDLAGIVLTKSLEDWLASYYQSLNKYDLASIEGPNFNLSKKFGCTWIDDLIGICSKEVTKENA